MTVRSRVVAAMACLACSGCGASSPSAPSLLNSIDAYDLTLTRCLIAGEEQPVVESFPLVSWSSATVGAHGWTLSQSGEVLSGHLSVSDPPFGASGSVVGRVSRTQLQITNLSYEGGSSHSNAETLSLAGTAVPVEDGFSGTLTGDYTSTPVFGGFNGTTSACHGEQMPFTLTRHK